MAIIASGENGYRILSRAWAECEFELSEFHISNFPPKVALVSIWCRSSLWLGLLKGMLSTLFTVHFTRWRTPFTIGTRPIYFPSVDNICVIVSEMLSGSHLFPWKTLNHLIPFVASFRFEIRYDHSINGIVIVGMGERAGAHYRRHFHHI